MTPEEESKVEELRLKHGTVIVYEDADFGVLVVRKPSRLEWRKFMSERTDDNLRDVANDNLVQRLVVYPDTAAFGVVLDEYPGLSMTLVNDITKKAGVKTLEGKKL